MKLKDLKQWKEESASSNDENQNKISQLQASMNKVEQTVQNNYKSISESMKKIATELKEHMDKQESGGKPTEIQPPRTTRSKSAQKVPITKAKISLEVSDEEDEGTSSEDEEKDPFEESLRAWDDSSQKSLENDTIDENALDGLHNTLHEVIICLRTQTYTNHDELDQTVKALSDMAKLDYPSRTLITDVCMRQAVILKLVTCFYQTVCVVSMESQISCDHIYGNQDLMQQVIDRVQAMI